MFGVMAVEGLLTSGMAPVADKMLIAYFAYFVVAYVFENSHFQT